MSQPKLILKKVSFPFIAFFLFFSSMTLYAFDLNLVGVYGNSFNDVKVNGNYAYMAGTNGLNVIDVSTTNFPVTVGFYRTDSPSKSIFVNDNKAYLACGNSGLVIVDVSIPSSPSYLGKYDTNGSAEDVYVAAGKAYVADGSAGIEIIDISDASSPVLLGSYDTDGTAVALTMSGGNAYVADGTGGLKIIDVSVPSSPSLLGSYNGGGSCTKVFVAGINVYTIVDSTLKIIDVSVISSPSLLGSYSASANDVYVSGIFAYLFSGSVISVVDVSIPSSPVLLANSEGTPGNAKSIDILGDHAFIAMGDSGLAVLNIKTGNMPTQLSSTNTTGDALDVFVSGNYAYVAEGSSGAEIFDVSDSAHPFLVSSFGVSTAQEINVENGIAYIANGNNGLQMYDVSDPTHVLYAGKYLGIWASGIHVLGTTAYVTDINAKQLLIINVSKPYLPVVLGTYSTGSSSPWDVYVSGTTAYVATSNGIMLIDVYNPASPALLSTISQIGTYSPIYSKNVYVSGSTIYFNYYFLNYTLFAGTGGREIKGGVRAFISDSQEFIASGNDGLKIFDQATGNPIGILNTSGFANSVYVSGNTAYVADKSGGLVIIDISEATGSAVPQLVGTLAETVPVNDVFVSGTNAYIGAGKNFSILDVNNPSTPLLLGSVDADNTIQRLTVLDTTAYIMGKSYLTSIDLSSQDSPSLMGSYYDSCSSLIDFCISDTTAYVTYGCSNKFGFFKGYISINIEDPYNLYPFFGKTFSQAVYGITISGNKIYLSGGDAGLLISGFGSYNTSGYASDLYVSGNTAYVADNIGGLVIIDVSNPSSPQLLGSYVTSGEVSSVVVTSTVAFIADSVDGLMAIDVKNPSSPQFLNSHKTYGTINNIFVSQNNAYVADGSGGLKIFEFTPPATPTIITLSSFGAKQSGKKVLIKWQTASELDNLGFNILRSESEPGPYTKINKKLIRAKGSSTKGASYKFKDKNIEAGKTYWYKLEDIDSKTEPSQHDAVKVEVTAKKIKAKK